MGYREFNVGAWPLGLEVRPHDSFIVDLSTAIDGYWSDSCATYYAGGPTARQIELHRFVERALEFAISLLKPGVMARQVDQQVRQFMADGGYTVYPHHTGHGVGVIVHEEPRLVPYNEMVLEPGMVVMVEPGIYFPGETSVRLEDAVLVTAAGPKVLTSHDKSLP
ncbi:MAG: aminopeptidase P family protein [Caldilineaceae bacterium]|nr:aminopeptidase P family protein [Caldilineaceae bacterium]